MTSTELNQRAYFGQLREPVTALHFRFFGSSQWWTEYFDVSPYVRLTPEGFKAALRPFCEFRA